MYVFMCVKPYGRTKKRYRPEIWYTFSRIPYQKTGCLIFRKNYPEAR